jgi:CO dehydrogenase nickel-insertion accessory protein CooC1
MDSDKNNVMAGTRLGFFGKGGAGKTTAVVLIARALVESGYTVCIVDADSTNVGLHQALGVDQPPSPLIDYFGGMIFSGGRVTCPVDDPTPLAGAEILLDQLPRDYLAQAGPHLYLLTGGKLGQWGAGAGCDGPISKIARDIHLKVDAEPVVTLVDFKAGFEDTARGVVTRLDWALVIVDPTRASLTLAGHMKDMVFKLRSGQKPATRHLATAELVATANRLFREAPLRGALFVLNKVDDKETESYMMQQLATHGIVPIGTIFTDRSISDAWLRGNEFRESAQTDLGAIVTALEKATSGAASAFESEATAEA